MLATLFHLLVGLLGLSLLYAALFLHENEEGQLQNRLEKMWITIDDLSKVALNKQTVFLQQVSAMANSVLNRLFGARLFSAGAVSTSLCFSLGSVVLFMAYLDPDNSRFLAAGTISFLVGLLPVPLRYFGFPWIIGFLSYVTYLDLRDSAGVNWKAYATLNFVPYLAIVAATFLSDVLFIAMSRWCLQKTAELKNGWKIAFLVTLNGFIGVSLISPMGLEIVSPALSNHLIARLGVNTYVNFVILGASNLVTGAIALLFVVLALAAIVHLAVWPLLERPIYSLQRFGVARKPKLLAAASVTCLLFAWPHSPIVQGISKLIHSG